MRGSARPILGSFPGEFLSFALLLAVAALAFANGANDNFKGVATLWGSGATGYKKALAWATVFTFAGSLAAIWAAHGLIAKFNGSKFLSPDIYMQPVFLGAVAGGAAVTVLLAAWLGLPISTTHALTGALLGAGTVAAGPAHVKFAALGAGVLLPLLVSPVAALLITITLFAAYRAWRGAGEPADCICVDAPQAMLATPGALAASAVSLAPGFRVAPAERCHTGTETIRMRPGDALHWLSAASISFARGLNDTPKIAALLLTALAGAAQFNYFLVAVAIALGGVFFAARVAETMSKKITPMATGEAVAANLTAASLVLLASAWALPVSTTHVTSGGIFGIGLLRRGEADWRRMRDILLSWVATLPLGAGTAAALYWWLAL